MVDGLDGPEEQSLRWCNRCNQSVPTIEWRVERFLNGGASIVHVGPMRNATVVDGGGPELCRYRERMPAKVCRLDQE